MPQFVAEGAPSGEAKTAGSSDSKNKVADNLRRLDRQL
jgi:hypothetical protein